MSALRTAALALYLCVCVVPLYFGTLYLLANRCRPYHEEALGRKWESLDASLQTLLLGMQKIIGGGLLAVLVGALFILFEPFRRGEHWATWALLLVFLAIQVPTLYATMLIHRRTGARTPVTPTATSIVLSVAAFALSLL
jgi:hypothetical protein